jgi:hypothetical protein
MKEVQKFTKLYSSSINDKENTITETQKEKKNNFTFY